MPYRLFIAFICYLHVLTSNLGVTTLCNFCQCKISQNAYWRTFPPPTLWDNISLRCWLRRRYRIYSSNLLSPQKRQWIKRPLSLMLLACLTNRKFYFLLSNIATIMPVPIAIKEQSIINPKFGINFSLLHQSRFADKQFIGKLSMVHSFSDSINLSSFHFIKALHFRFLHKGPHMGWKHKAAPDSSDAPTKKRERTTKDTGAALQYRQCFVPQRWGVYCHPLLSSQSKTAAYLLATLYFHDNRQYHWPASGLLKQIFS